jgi:hypothetical protein
MQTNDSQHQSWRDRAREIRALGDQMHDLLARDEMLRLATTTRVWVVMAKAVAPRVSVTAKEADKEDGSLAFAFAVTAG